MAKRILRLINKEIGSINQAAFLLGLFALLAQFLGLIRDRLLVHFLGPGLELDIYYAAFRVPDLIFVSIASLFAITALLPSLNLKIGRDTNGELNTDAPKNAQKFFSDVFTVFLVTIILICALAFLLMPFLTKLIAPGFDGEALEQVTYLSRIMLLSPILLGFSNLFGSITQLFRKFFVFALSPFFYNLGIIIGIILLYPFIGIPGLALGVVLGALLHFGVNIPVVIRHRFLPYFSRAIDWQGIKNLVKLSLPRTLGLALYSIVFLIIVAIASTMGEGSVSILNLSFNIHAVPITIIGLSYSVAAFPSLARYFSVQDIESYIRQIGLAAKQIIFWSLPVTFLFIVLRAQIIRVILGTSNFSWENTRLAAAMFALFSISVVAQSLNTLFVRAFYAGGKTRRPLLVNIFSLFLIVGLSFIFLYVFKAVPEIKTFFESLLRVKGLPGTELMAIGLGYSIGIICNFFLLWRFFRRDFTLAKNLDFLGRVFWQSLLGALTIAAVAYGLLGVFDNIFDINTFYGIFMQGFLAGILGIAGGVVVLHLLKNQELLDVWQTVRSKFWKIKAISPEQSRRMVAPPQEKL